MTKLRWTWLLPCLSNLLRHSAVRNVLLPSQHLCRPPRRYPRHHLHLQEGVARGQSKRQVQFLTSRSTLIALKVTLQNLDKCRIAILGR